MADTLGPTMMLREFENGYWYLDQLKNIAERIGVPDAKRLRKDELERAGGTDRARQAPNLPRFEKIPHGRYINFVAEFLAANTRATRAEAIAAWTEVKTLDVPKNCASRPCTPRHEPSAGRQKHRSHATRWQRYEKPQPGHRLRMDVKFLERIPGTRKRLYQFTAIDDCTRLRILKIYDACNQGTAIRCVDDVLRRLPFRVQVVQTDNGAEFQSHLHWHLQNLDIRHVYIRPRTPHLNGKVERSHRVDDQEF